MINFIKKLYVFSTLFSFVIFSHLMADSSFDMQKAKWHKAALVAVVNKSAQKIQLSNGGLNESVLPGNLSLKNQYIIPFISMKLHMRQILNDKLYIPDEALRITTHAGTFGLWEDERGIQMCSLEVDIFAENCVESLLSRNHLRFALPLTLQINTRGFLALSGV